MIADLKKFETRFVHGPCRNPYSKFHSNHHYDYNKGDHFLDTWCIIYRSINYYSNQLDNIVFQNALGYDLYNIYSKTKM